MGKSLFVLWKKTFQKMYSWMKYFTVFPQGRSQEKNFIQINTKKVYNLVPPSSKIMIMPWNYHLSAIQVVCTCCASPWILPCNAIQYQLFEKMNGIKLIWGDTNESETLSIRGSIKRPINLHSCRLWYATYWILPPKKYSITTLPVNYNAVKLAYFFSIQQKTLYLKQNAI